jgi:diketogulonate reductase-like aldo/keto reductase
MEISSRVKLNNGVEMPWLGLGVFRVADGNEVRNAVITALTHGYRSIDTAEIYGNEAGVGEGIIESGVPRDEIFLTSKVWNEHQGYKKTIEALEKSLERLQTNYLDLYLIHWPKGKISVETWSAMEELYRNGKVRAIGLSNFLVRQLNDFLPHCNIIPAVNQIEFHPRLVQPDLLIYCKQRGIRPEAWRPIMKGEVNNIPVLQKLAEKYKKTPVQIVLRWDIQKGVVTIPKSVHKERIISNADIFDFELSDEDVHTIDMLDTGTRLSLDPNVVEKE